MSNPFTGKVSQIYDARAKIEKELCKLYESIDDAIQGNSMRVKVEGLVKRSPRKCFIFFLALRRRLLSLLCRLFLSNEVTFNALKLKLTTYVPDDVSGAIDSTILRKGQD